MASRLGGAASGAPTLRVVCARAAAVRLDAARAFVDTFPADTEIVVIAASRGAAEDFVRRIACDRGAVAGLHRFSLGQLAARLAAPVLAAGGTGPASALGTEAVAARAAFEAGRAEALDYFHRVAAMPGFPRALASTLQELRGAGVAATDLTALPRAGGDLAALLERFEAQFAEAGAADRAALFRAAAEAAREGATPWSGRPLLLLDVACDAPVEWTFVRALLSRAPAALVTIPHGDEPARRAFGEIAAIEILDEPDADHDLVHLRRHLFEPSQPAEREGSGEVVWFSAPGEGRECVEIARFILDEARRGVRFDEMAVLLRAPQRYHGLLEHALARAGIPAWFDRGTRRPHPAGRAFLLLLACRLERLSAARFAEYLSLAQVPPLETDRRAEPPSPSLPADELLEALLPEVETEPERPPSPPAPVPADDGTAVVEGSLRAPWKWEKLLVESAVIGGAERWRRRLDGLERELELRRDELRRRDPDDPRIVAIDRDLVNLRHLKTFALPVIEELAGWPEAAPWGEWLERFEALAPRVLREPDGVLRVLSDLRPMAAVGPVRLDEVVRVLGERLRAVEAPPPRRRYGRVFVGSPHQARGRLFRVVFVPGLAGRVFPQRLREDPLLADEQRARLGAGLPVEEDRAATERLLLRLAAGAAADRLYVSYARIDAAEGRERVPSFYALEIVRAVRGRLPSPDELRQMAARATDASLAWPAPGDPARAIDDLEHDLAVLRPLLAAKDPAAAHGRARYLFDLSPELHRSLTAAWERWQKRWTSSDGLVRPSTAVQTVLEANRLGARPYSVSLLQRFAECPYKFFLAGFHRLEPVEVPEPLQRLDPLTKGSFVHRVQAEFFRALEDRGLLPVTRERLEAALRVLADTLDAVARALEEELAPAIDRVWKDEVEAIHQDLRAWVRDLAADGAEWVPERFELAFGLEETAGRDPRSRPEPVVLDGGYLLRGSVDLVERRVDDPRKRRVTDHKTGRNRLRDRVIVDGGRALQPVLYGLAVEQACGGEVVEGRLSFCTAEGGHAVVRIPLDRAARDHAREVLRIVDDAVATGFLPAAPASKACQWCEFVPVCGLAEERRVSRKPADALAALDRLRALP
jgi:CRISPR/Cas system-associated exonuclease Cas4 (RecB family)